MRDAALHATMHRTVPTTKSYPAPEVNSAEVAKTCYEESLR